MQYQKLSRRKFINYSGKLGIGIPLLGLSSCSDSSKQEKSNGQILSLEENTSNKWFDISLAQWSLHRMIKAQKLDTMGFAAFTKKTFGLNAIEYVSGFFKDGTNKNYLKELNKRALDNGVKQLLIMIDGIGDLGSPNDMDRKKAVINHYKWVEAAKLLDCHSIRVNAYGKGNKKDIQKAAIAGLGALGQYAKASDLNVIVENHGSYSSDGIWLSEIMRQVNLDNVGTLPDFGNFCIEREGGDRWSGKCINEYDRYKGIKEMLPFAKGLSAKSHDFDVDGNETHTDYEKMLRIVKASGYKGYIGVEYEGNEISEIEGIKKTISLLKRYNR